tara:strand:- start:503 stop:706 length:204 start_codon:yes stop_codon:yes gene_type:complete
MILLGRTDLPLKTIVRIVKSFFFRRDCGGEFNLDASPAITRNDTAINTQAVYKFFVLCRQNDGFEVF